MRKESKKADYKISIIVPVYNTERYLNQCINSLSGQTLEQIEIILVDDGSTDNSGVICDRYAQEDHHIKVLHQCNGGRVNARKNGLIKALGKYILFVDSDDWIAPGMCEEMLCLIEKYEADLVTSGYVCEEGGFCRTETDAFPEGLYTSKEQLNELVLNAMLFKGMDKLGLLSSVWTKLYRKEIALDVIKRIPESMRRGEDFAFNSLYLLKCRSIYISKEVFYHYRCYEGSTVTSPCPDFIQQIGMSHLLLQNAFAGKENGEEMLKRMNIRILLNFIRLWNHEIEQQHIPYYCFDYGKLGEGRTILYGAGKTGMDYYMQFIKTMPGKLVLWVDKNYKKYQDKGYEVLPVEKIKSVEFDKIFIAVESEKLALEIQQELIEKFRICKEKISWQKPKCYWI